MDKPVDGRNLRATRTRAAIIEACRARMLAGDFRPAVTGVAADAKCSVRSVFQHFREVEQLHQAALDVPTRHAIATIIMPRLEPTPPLEADRVVFAAVFGRPIPNADGERQPL